MEGLGELSVPGVGEPVVAQIGAGHEDTVTRSVPGNPGRQALEEDHVGVVLAPVASPAQGVVGEVHQGCGEPSANTEANCRRHRPAWPRDCRSGAQLPNPRCSPCHQEGGEQHDRRHRPAETNRDDRTKQHPTGHRKDGSDRASHRKNLDGRGICTRSTAQCGPHPATSSGLDSERTGDEDGGPKSDTRRDEPCECCQCCSKAADDDRPRLHHATIARCQSSHF